jgi:hypothetical protein
MSSHLEEFVQDHRDQFDDESPAPELWDKIRDRMQGGEVKKEAPVRSLPPKRWLSAAAAVVLVCASGWLYYSLHQKPVASPLAINQQPQAADTGRKAKTNLLPDTASAVTQELAGAQTTEPKKPDAGKIGEPADTEQKGYSEEMYYYSKLIEIKHNELKTLQKDEPLLYRKFSGDVNKLDSVYQTLKTQLPQNPYREQLIEAMIYNLKLQIGLLNKQLDIIKQIKHSKKSAYEKAYKSV